MEAKDLKKIRVTPGKKVRMKNYKPDFTGSYKKEVAKEQLHKEVLRLAKYQDVLYAQDTYALLIIFQAMDAAGKDGTIKWVMSGVNPQGVQVFSFKAPSSEEMDHDYLWRTMKAVPERGRIGIFNRSYYEEVLIARVHPNILEAQKIPAKKKKDKRIWKERYAHINNYEQYLNDNGVHVLKFFLNVSKDEQRKRFLERIEDPTKNWKFSFNDVKERAHWDRYQEVYEDVLTHTSTEHAPWHIIPADNKWFTRIAVAEIICDYLKSLKLKYPTMSKAHLAQLAQARQALLSEKGAKAEPAKKGPHRRSALTEAAISSGLVSRPNLEQSQALEDNRMPEPAKAD